MQSNIPAVCDERQDVHERREVVVTTTAELAEHGTPIEVPTIDSDCAGTAPNPFSLNVAAPDQCTRDLALDGQLTKTSLGPPRLDR
jgi:hypothetical protein